MRLPSQMSPSRSLPYAALCLQVQEIVGDLEGGAEQKAEAEQRLEPAPAVRRDQRPDAGWMIIPSQHVFLQTIVR